MHTDRVLDALASGPRRAMLRALAERERTTGELAAALGVAVPAASRHRSEEHTSELQSQSNLVCRLLLEKKKDLRYHSAGADDAAKRIRQNSFRSYFSIPEQHEECAPLLAR